MTEKVVTTKTCELSFLEGDIVHARFNADRVVNATEVQEMFEVRIGARWRGCRREAALPGPVGKLHELLPHAL